MLTNIEIPQLFKNVDFDNFIVKTVFQQESIQILRNYTEDITKNIQSSKNILLYGGIGTGKTHLAYALAKSAIKAGHSAKVEHYYDFIRDIVDTDIVIDENNCSTWFDCRSYHEINLNKYLHCDVLVLDNILYSVSKKYFSGIEEDILYDLLKRRKINRKATIFISNQLFFDNPTPILQMIKDDVINNWIMIHCDGNDYRLRNNFGNNI